MFSNAKLINRISNMYAIYFNQYVYTYRHTRSYMFLYKCMYMYMHMHMYMYIHIYIYAIISSLSRRYFDELVQKQHPLKSREAIYILLKNSFYSGSCKNNARCVYDRFHTTSPTPPTSMLQAYASSTCANINERFFCTLRTLKNHQH